MPSGPRPPGLLVRGFRLANSKQISSENFAVKPLASKASDEPQKATGAGIVEAGNVWAAVASWELIALSPFMETLSASHFH